MSIKLCSSLYHWLALRNKDEKIFLNFNLGLSTLPEQIIVQKEKNIFINMFNYKIKKQTSCWLSLVEPELTLSSLFFECHLQLDNLEKPQTSHVEIFYFHIPQTNSTKDVTFVLIDVNLQFSWDYFFVLPFMFLIRYYIYKYLTVLIHVHDTNFVFVIMFCYDYIAVCFLKLLYIV